MISYLSGTVIRMLPNGAIVDIAGIGYELNLTIPCLSSIEIESKTDFWIYTKVREDAITLYGFKDWQERSTFSLLLGINGVGPKVALAILSTINFRDIYSIVQRKEAQAFHQVPGIGKRTADKILLELEGKQERLQISGREVFQTRVSHKSSEPLFNTEQPSFQNMKLDVMSALENLGFKNKVVRQVLIDIEEEYEGESFATIVKRALTLLTKKPEKQPLASIEGASSKGSIEDLQGLF